MLLHHDLGAHGRRPRRRLSVPRPLVLRNVFPLQAHTRLDRPAGAGPPAFIWFSQTIGPGRGLELFLSAWGRMAVPAPLYLLGDEKPGYRQKLLSLVPPERRELLRLLLLVPPDKLPDKLAEFDIGLALEVPWPLNRDITISNKIFQYMNAGLAVVATIPPARPRPCRPRPTRVC